MTKKRFTEIISIQKVIDNKTRKEYDCLIDDELLILLNKLNNENEQLRQELKIYRKVASCSNCEYQNYDWFEDGDEFEICERGNNEQQIEYHICEEWSEL